MIKSFSDYLSEAKGDVYFVFGRFNPPTNGHEKLFDKLKSTAGSGTYRIYASKSQDPKKNPLSFKDKIKFLRKMFPKHARSIMADADVRTALDIVVKLYDQGYTSATMIAGSDRVKEFEALLNKYNGVKSRHGFYNFEKGIKVISAGERDPDADDVSGMSASKLRAYATDNDLENFSKGMPKGYKDSKSLFNAIRKGMGLKESHDHRKHLELEPVSETREKFVQGKLFNVGDEVVLKENNSIGTIKRCGTNFLVVEFGDWKKRVWLDQVELLEKDERKKKQKQDQDIKDRPGTQPKDYYGKDAKGKEMSKDTKQARARHFEKGAKMDDDNPDAYKKAPGDASAKTKPSKHTKKYQKMFGEETLSLAEFMMDEGKADAALKKKADKTGMPLGILRQVFNRGVAAWRTGHRPGTNSVQWGLARVNSFVTKSKGTWGGADKDLASKVRGS